MHEVDECASRYQKLLRLMEEDFAEIAQGLGGDILETYRELLNREMDILKSTLKSMQQNI